MKYATLLLIFVVFGHSAFSQLKADAGRDTTWCMNTGWTGLSGKMLGGASPAANGTPPYTYNWSSIEFAPNDAFYLDTTTIPHPRFKQMMPSNIDSGRFILSVTDAGGAVASDTMTIYFSRWACTLGECIHIKRPEDTVSLSASCRSNFQPFTYRWSPAAYLSDSSAGSPRSWSPVSQTYSLIQTDSKGCQSTSTCDVSIDRTSVPEAPALTHEAIVTPNPVTEGSILRAGASWKGGTVSIFSGDGRLIGNLPVSGANTRLQPIIPSSPGIYFYQIRSLSGSVRYGKLIRQ